MSKCKNNNNSDNNSNNNNNIGNELSTLLSSQVLSRLTSSRNMRIAEFDAITAILIKTQIPFDVQYTPGTRRDAESAELKIYINPTTTLNFVLSFQAGSSIFTGANV